MDGILKPNNTEKVTDKAKQASAEASAAPATSTPIKPSQKSLRRRKMAMIIIAVVLIALIVGAVLLGRGDGESGNVGSTDLNNIKTYLSKSAADENKSEQSSFTLVDPIQAGFTLHDR